MITLVSELSTSKVFAAQGQLVKVCGRFISDQNLTGYQVNVNPGMWIVNLDNAPTLSPGFSRVYPMTVGSYEMTFQGIDNRYKNLRCELYVISATEFVITYYFIQTRDKYSLTTGGYLKEYNYNSISEIEDNGGEVFKQNRKLDLKITVDFVSRVDICHHLIEWQVKPFRQDANFSFITGGEYRNGWLSGEDLEVKVQLFDVQASNEMYVSIYRVDNGTNNIRFIEDLEYNLAYCISSPFTTGQSDVPFSAIIESNGWAQINNWFECNFKIDKDYFTSGGTYRIYITYKNVLDNESIISPLIPEIILNDIEQIDCDYEVEATFETPNDTFTDHCYYNVNPCQLVELKVKLDKTSFDLDLIAKGYTGITFDNTIQRVTHNVTNNLAINGLSIFNNWVNESIVDGTPLYESILSFIVPEDWAGLTRYVNFRFNFLFPNGDTFVLVAPILLTITEFSDDIEYIGADNVYICDTATDETFTFTVPDSAGADFEVKISAPIMEDLSDSKKGTNDTTVEVDVVDVTVDYSKIPYGVNCLKLMSSLKVEGDTSCQAECNWASIIVKKNSRPKDSLLFTWFFENIFVPGCIKKITFTDRTTGVILSDTLYSGSPIESGTFIVQSFKVTGWVDVVILTNSGYVYNLKFNVQKSEINEGGADGKTYYDWWCSDPEVEIPVEALPCSAKPSLVITCDEVSEQWEALLDEDVYVIDSFQYTHNGIDWFDYVAAVNFGSETEIQFRAVLMLGTPCGTIELWGSAYTCNNCVGTLPVDQCEEFLSIKQIWDENTETLELQETLDGGCAIDDEIVLQYSYDGINYVAYTVPIDTSETDKVFYKRWITCVDGCEKSITTYWERECHRNDCSSINYSNLDEKQVMKLGGTGGDTFTIPSGALYVKVHNLGIKECSYIIDGITSALKQGQIYEFVTIYNNVTKRQSISRDIEVTIPASGSVSLQVQYPIELNVDLSLL